MNDSQVLAVSGDPLTMPGPILTSILYPMMVAFGVKDPGFHKPPKHSSEGNKQYCRLNSSRPPVSGMQSSVTGISYVLFSSKFLFLSLSIDKLQINSKKEEEEEKGKEEEKKEKEEVKKEEEEVEKEERKEEGGGGGRGGEKKSSRA
ncbi:hypothetical protein STEG23_035872, partial [Scotinomys teguina]